MKMARGFLLGTAAGLVVMSSALAADLPMHQAKAVEYAKVSGNYATINLGAIGSVFFQAPFGIPGGSFAVFKPLDTVMSPRIASVPAYAARANAYRMVEGAGLGDKIGQKLRSSAMYRGSPSHGFSHVLGKKPLFATKMIA